MGVVRPFLPSGHSLWGQGSHSGCLPPALPHPSLPCLSTHPSICLSAADLCPRGAAWAGQGPGSKPPGRSVGGTLAPASPAQRTPWPPARSQPGVPGSCSALGLGAVLVSVPQCPEWGWPAGQALGWLRGDWWLRWRGPGLVREEGSLHLPAPLAAHLPPPAEPGSDLISLGFLSLVETLSFICLFSLSLSLPLPLSLFFFLVFFFCLLFCVPRQPIE